MCVGPPADGTLTIEKRRKFTSSLHFSHWQWVQVLTANLRDCVIRFRWACLQIDSPTPLQGCIRRIIRIGIQFNPSRSHETVPLSSVAEPEPEPPGSGLFGGAGAAFLGWVKIIAGAGADFVNHQ